MYLYSSEFEPKNPEDVTYLVPKKGIGFSLEDSRNVHVTLQGKPFLRIRGLTSEQVNELVDSKLIREENLPEILLNRNLFCEALTDKGKVVATAESIKQGSFSKLVVSNEQDLKLVPCRFVVASSAVNSSTTGVVLENPYFGTRIWISQDNLAELYPVAVGSKPVSELQRKFLIMLLQFGFLLPEDSDFINSEEYQMWDTPDLYFHSRSRLGRTDHEFGGVFPYIGTKIHSRPARNTHWDSKEVRIKLPVPVTPLGSKTSLDDVMTHRHSTRYFSQGNVSLEQLGEYLYRSARVTRVIPAASDVTEGPVYETSHRPYPTGGAAYELEIYVTCLRVEGVDTGIYWYDPFSHELVAVSLGAESANQVLSSARRSAGGNVNPQIILTLTSRLGRLNWKYRSIAYATTLKHVGVVYQTFYLVAADMGLGACGLGSGNSDEFGDLLGLDYLKETSVGDFMLGVADS